MSLAETLQKTDLFKEVALPDLEALINRMQRSTFPAGTVLFNMGDDGDKMYIILSGKIRIYIRDTEGNDLTVTHYQENQIFGELSLLDQQPRSAFAEAAETLEVFILSREAFLEFLTDRPTVGMAMIQSLTHRIRHTTNFLEEVNQRRAMGIFRVVEEKTQDEW